MRAFLIRWLGTAGPNGIPVLRWGWHCQSCTAGIAKSWAAGEKTHDDTLELSEGRVSGSEDPVRCARCGRVLSTGLRVPDLNDVVGLPEIAEQLGVVRGTADMWRRRGVLPPPSGRVGRSPSWRWSEIEQWARETGRLAS